MCEQNDVLRELAGYLHDYRFEQPPVYVRFPSDLKTTIETLAYEPEVNEFLDEFRETLAEYLSENDDSEAILLDEFGDEISLTQTFVELVESLKEFD